MEYRRSVNKKHWNPFWPHFQDKNKSNKHTVVYLHGGGFIFGGAPYYKADYMMERDDLILVVINYRLNAFGFMSFEDNVVPGNYGSLDQVQALK